MFLISDLPAPGSVMAMAEMHFPAVIRGMKRSICSLEPYLEMYGMTMSECKLKPGPEQLQYILQKTKESLTNNVNSYNQTLLSEE